MVLNRGGTRSDLHGKDDSCYTVENGEWAECLEGDQLGG